jgi:hypothetical protein
MRTRRKLVLAALLLAAALLGSRRPATAERQWPACLPGEYQCSCLGHFVGCMASREACVAYCGPYSAW